MNVIDERVITPIDDSIGYELNWRYRVAGAVCADTDKHHRLPQILAKDSVLSAYMRHVRHRSKTPLKPAEPMGMYDRIEFWHDDATGHMLEAYLVTAAPHDEIHTDLGIAVDDVRAYENIFFNVRDKDVPRRGVIARLRVDTRRNREDQRDRSLLLAALAGGLQALRAVLRTGPDMTNDNRDSHELINDLVNGELLRRIVAGEMTNSDLSRLSANHVAHQRMVIETGQGTESRDVQEMKEAWIEIMQLSSPKMVKPSKTKAQMAGETETLHAKFKAEQKVNQTPITDLGEEEGTAKLNAMMQHFAN